MKTGDKVSKPKGYSFDGIIVSVFKTTKGETRIVAELENNGMLHIFSESQLVLRDNKIFDFVPQFPEVLVFFSEFGTELVAVTKTGLELRRCTKAKGFAFFEYNVGRALTSEEQEKILQLYNRDPNPIRYTYEIL